MNIDECIKQTEELINLTDSIISQGALIKNTILIDKYRDIFVQTKQLIRTLFPDADERIKDIDKSMDLAAQRDGPPSFRTSFLEQAKTIRRYLISIKDTLKLRESVEIKENKLDSLKMKVEEKEIEAERREKVAETKFYGAAIEIIDRLRDQLKNEGDIKQEILNIKNELIEIKEGIKKLTH